jgi:N6-L-threonylcarbamoyladenine synthase
LIFCKLYVKIVFVLWPRRLAWSRTPDFHSGNTGSNPVEAASIGSQTREPTVYMKILAIETSCDETAISVLECDASQVTVLSNAVSSQVKIHAQFGGVVPSLAAREHANNIEVVFKNALENAHIGDFEKEIDLIAVTVGPGLAPALLIGIAFAKTLAFKYSKSLIPVNHMEGHVYSNWLKDIGTLSSYPDEKIFPALNLIVSGGHTEIVLMKSLGRYEIIGETLDDAVGEAFDKVARLIGLPYPGGPQISQRAAQHTQSSLEAPIIFPRPMIKSKNYDFSYSGLKTAVLYKVRELKEKHGELSDEIINELCFEFQEAATDVLVSKTIKAAQEYDIKNILLSGGVSANKRLREKLSQSCSQIGAELFQPEMTYTTDNAAMIGIAGYFKYTLAPENEKSFSWESVDMNANLRIQSQ